MQVRERSCRDVFQLSPPRDIHPQAVHAQAFDIDSGIITDRKRAGISKCIYLGFKIK